MKKLRIYSGSMMALTLNHPLASPGMQYIEHSAWMAIVESQEIADDQAMQKALTIWPRSEGWYQHDAKMHPAPAEFYADLFEARFAGVLDTGEDSEEEADIVINEDEILESGILQ